MLAGASGLSAQTTDIAITEVSADPPGSGSEYIEIANLSSSAVDTTGYTITVWDTTAATVTTSLAAGEVTMLAGIMQPGDVWIVGDTTIAPPGYTQSQNYGSNMNFANWKCAVAIRDGSGNMVDFVTFNANPSTITSPFPIPSSEWTGSFSNVATFSTSWQRIGNTDTNSYTDWANSAQTLGSVSITFIPPESTFVGPSPASAAAWNVASNWDNGVPDSDTGVVIPSGKDVTLPLNNPTIPTLRVEDGGTLRGDAAGGGVTLTDGYEIENNANIIMGNAVVTIAGTNAFDIITGTENIGNINVTNTGGQVRVTDTWSISNDGTVTIANGCSLIFGSIASNFSGTSFQNNGTIIFEDDRPTVSAPLQMVINSTVAVDLGNVEINLDPGQVMINALPAPDILFSNEITFNNISFSAGSLGWVQWADTLTVNGTFNIDQGVVVQVDNGIAGATQNMAGDWEGGGTLIMDPIQLAGAPIQQLAIQGNLEMADVQYLTSDSFTLPIGLSLSGTFTYDAAGSLTIGGNVEAAAVEVLGAAGLTINGNLTLADLNYVQPAAGNLNIGGLLNVSNNLTFDSEATMVVDSLTVRNLTILKDGTLTVNNATSISGDLADSSMATVNVGSVAFSGNSPQSAVSTARPFVMDRMTVFTPGGLTIGGEFTLNFGANDFSGNATIRVFSFSSLLLNDNAHLRVGATNSARLRLDGAFVTQSGSVNRPDHRSLEQQRHAASQRRKLDCFDQRLEPAGCRTDLHRRYRP